MAALITLTAIAKRSPGGKCRGAASRPGHIEQHVGCSTKTVEICGRELARTTKPVRTVGDVRDAVRAFGTAIRERDPQGSFAVLVGVRRGDRKPRGFDVAQRGNGFGQDDFLLARDERPEQADAPAAAVPVQPAAA